MKKELSVFIDESGDFGDYQKYCPFYIVTFVLHDQRNILLNEINHLDENLSYFNIKNNYIHAGPIIRQEDDYYRLSLIERRKIINIALNFIRKAPLHYHAFVIDKSYAKNEKNVKNELNKLIIEFAKNNNKLFENFNNIKVYYDNGQKQLSSILMSTLPSIVSKKILFKQIVKKQYYKLFQVADIICTLELIKEKLEKNIFSKTECIFFKTRTQFIKNYYKIIQKKKI